MYKIKIVTNFSAAHSLRGYKGKCESLHGHNWKVEVLVSSEKLNSLGIAIDFQELKKITSKVLEELDHKHINDLEYFRKVNPSSEQIARYIFLRLKKLIANQKYRLGEVLVWETETSCAGYSE